MTPSFYDPARVGTLYSPDLQSAFAEGTQTYKSVAEKDSPRVLAFLIDIQVDFVFPAPIGRLSVPNAVDDTRRTIEWIYRNLNQITHIAASVDTHIPYQIFFSSWWRDKDGNRPPPFTVITASDVLSGRWIATQDEEWSTYYVQELESIGKKQLMIWPYHCIDGTEGRTLPPALTEAIMYHSAARRAQPTYLTKGTIPQTEFYSAMEPEVKFQGHPDGDINTRFLRFVSEFDLIYIAGQARSHCVVETMNSVLRYFAGRSDIFRKIRFLDDCTSSITGFEEQTELQIANFASQGIRLVKSTEPLG